MNRILLVLQYLIDRKVISIFDYRSCTSVINTAKWYDQCCANLEAKAIKEMGDGK